MIRRALFMTAFFLASAGLLAHARRPASPLPREPLMGLSYAVGGWQGRAGPPFETKVLAVLHADDYVTRVYEKGSHVVGLYIGYHGQQRHDESIHSPMNCLPGAGWEPLSFHRMAIRDGRPSPDPAGEVIVNNVLIQKGEQRQVVLYWYQSHGRVVASEYVSKAYLFFDALRESRTDAALVRLVTPVGDAGPRAAELLAQQFAVALLPLLDPHIPN
jgi:EpsI family protein